MSPGSRIGIHINIEEMKETAVRAVSSLLYRMCPMKQKCSAAELFLLHRGLREEIERGKRKKYLQFWEKYAKLTKLWHDSDEA